VGSTPTQIIRRRFVIGAGLSLFFSACKEKKMKMFLNISLFSYLDRPIFDVIMNGTDFGGALEHSFYGSNAVMIDQPIALGKQMVTWRLDGPEGAPGNGDTVIAKNVPLLQEIPKEIKSLGLHIYADNTVEIILSRGLRAEQQSERGRKIVQEWRNRNG
jgi:hypothetical protein